MVHTHPTYTRKPTGMFLQGARAWLEAILLGSTLALIFAWVGFFAGRMTAVPEKVVCIMQPQQAQSVPSKPMRYEAQAFNPMLVQTVMRAAGSLPSKKIRKNGGMR